jgi:hypothetical protein
MVASLGEPNLQRHTAYPQLEEAITRHFQKHDFTFAADRLVDADRLASFDEPLV